MTCFSADYFASSSPYGMLRFRDLYAWIEGYPAHHGSSTERSWVRSFAVLQSKYASGGPAGKYRWTKSTAAWCWISGRKSFIARAMGGFRSGNSVPRWLDLGATGLSGWATSGLWPCRTGSKPGHRSCN